MNISYWLFIMKYNGERLVLSQRFRGGQLWPYGLFMGKISMIEAGSEKSDLTILLVMNYHELS